MLASQPKKTSFGEILLAIKAQIMADTGLPAARVLIIGRNQQLKHQAEQIIYIRPGRYTSLQAENDGGGRTNTRLSRQVDIILLNRHATDPLVSDESFLCDPERGFFALEDAAIGALQDFFPTDAEGNSLLYEPMRIYAGAQPEKEPKNAPWGQASATFEAGYCPPLVVNVNRQ